MQNASIVFDIRTFSEKQLALKESVKTKKLNVPQERTAIARLILF